MIDSSAGQDSELFITVDAVETWWVYSSPLAVELMHAALVDCIRDTRHCLFPQWNVHQSVGSPECLQATNYELMNKQLQQYAVISGTGHRGRSVASATIEWNRQSDSRLGEPGTGSGMPDWNVAG